MDSFDLRELARNQFRIAARRHDPHFRLRKGFGTNARDDLADQAAIAVNRSRHHGTAGGLADRIRRFAQGELRQQCGSLIKEAGHRFESRSDDPADVVPFRRDNIESNRGSEIHDDGRAAIQLRDRRRIREAVCADSFRRGIINTDTKIALRVDEEEASSPNALRMMPSLFGTTDETTTASTARA